MLVASDTSPISNLAIIGRLSLLNSQFQEIWIPTTVLSELRALRHPPAFASVDKALRDGWIRQRAVQDTRIVRLLQCGLDRGEAETIALGMELPAALTLLDERAGRAAALHAGLSITGVLGVLLRAKTRGEIPLVKPELHALRNSARFFITRPLEAQILHIAGE